MELKDYAAAANAFSHTVGLDPEVRDAALRCPALPSAVDWAAIRLQYGDAWNNLAACHLHLRNKCVQLGGGTGRDGTGREERGRRAGP